MADTKNTKTEVGVIGQKYQNRKTKKIGTIESRDEKYKTLLMKSDDGKTFNVVYSTFKSDWRKFDDGKSVDAEEKNEPVKTEKKVEKTVEKKVKVDKSEEKEKKIKAIMETFETVKSIVEKSKTDLAVKKNSRGGVVIHYKRKTLFEIWTKGDSYTIYSPFKIKFSDSNVQHEHIDKDKWLLKERYRIKNLKSGVAEAIEAMKPIVEKLEKEAADKKVKEAADDKKSKK